MQQSIINPDWTTLPKIKTADGRPKVTVLLITYNHAKYIAEALDSILEQETDFSFAIHVIDDCSTDGAQDIIRDYAARYPGVVKPFINKKNIGHKVTQKNFYRGMQTLDGEYICILEGDDYWASPYRLQKHVEFLEANPDFVGCANNTIKVYEDGTGREPHLLHPANKEIHDVHDMIMISSFFHASSLTFRNVFRGKVPRYLRSPLSCDIFITIAHAQFGKIKLFNEAWNVYRAHAAGMFSQMSQTKGWMWNIDSFRACSRWLRYRHFGTFARSIWNYCDILLANGVEADGFTPKMRRKYEGVRRRYRWADKAYHRLDAWLSKAIPGRRAWTAGTWLNLGSGHKRPLRMLNADVRAETDPEFVTDLERTPWPWPDNYTEEVWFMRSMEHMGRDPKTFAAMMRELYRVCQPGARVVITAKHPWTNAYINDPTCVRPVTATMLSVFDRATLPSAEPEPMAERLGVDFELTSRTINLDEPYRTQFQNGQIGQGEIAQLLDSSINVANAFVIELRVHKPPRPAAKD